MQKLKQAMELSMLIESCKMTIEEAMAIMNSDNVYWFFE